jgi:hypothetical protein
VCRAVGAGRPGVAESGLSASLHQCDSPPESRPAPIGHSLARWLIADLTANRPVERRRIRHQFFTGGGRNTRSSRLLDQDISKERPALLQGNKDSGGNPVERYMFSAFLAALLLIAFVLGSIATTAQIFPGTFIAQAYQGGQALYDQMTSYDDLYKTDLWYPARNETRGVGVSDPGRALDGPTLFTAGDGAVARLIDLDGRVLHEWRKPKEIKIDAV